ncbi:hypothetical protein GN956_G19456 [Arapaima gigas]
MREKVGIKLRRSRASRLAVIDRRGQHPRAEDVFAQVESNQRRPALSNLSYKRRLLSQSLPVVNLTKSSRIHAWTTPTSDPWHTTNRVRPLDFLNPGL